MQHAHLLVIGGGITGQLVQAAIPSAVVLDWRTADKAPKMTRQYGANYLWEPVPGFRCSSFPVVTEVDGRPATEASIRAYKAKIGKSGEGADDWGLQFAHQTTGWEFDALPTPRISWGATVIGIDIEEHRVQVLDRPRVSKWIYYDTLVTTIPQYALRPILHGEAATHLPLPDYRWQPIHVRVTPVPPDAPHGPGTVYVNYNSHPDIPVYRTTDRDGERHYESLNGMSTIPTRRLIPGKIYPNVDARRLADMLVQHDIFSMGRYATWDTNELVHQTAQRIQTLPRLPRS